MPSFLRASLLMVLLALPVIVSGATPSPTPKPDKKIQKAVVAAPAPIVPVPPAVVVPASVNVVTFQCHDEGQSRKVIVTLTPTLVRVDTPDDRLSLIYDPKTELYTGLEHNNYTYWQFSWSDVKTIVETSKRYEGRLRDLNNEGAGNYVRSTDTNAPAATPPVTGDNSGYIWTPSNQKKKIADIECVLWNGNTASGETVEAWCATGPVPSLQAAMEQLRIINEPMALVPIRTIVQPFVFVIYDSLTKGGVTPVAISWGFGHEKNYFNYVGTKKKDGQAKAFTVPKTYTKTTLATMDDLVGEKK